MSRWPSVTSALALVVACVLVPSAARAAPQDDASAEALFLDGRKLMDAGRFDEACAKFAASQRFSPGVGTLLNLGDCYEKAGKLASAWAVFRDAIEASQRAGREDREVLARDRAKALEGQLGKLSLSVTGARPGLVVKRDGIEVDPAAFGVAVPVDAGEHRVEASAPGYATWAQRVVTKDRGVHSVAIPELERDDATAAPPSGAGGGDPSPSDGDAGSAQRTWGWVGVGVGAAGLAAGGVFALLAKSKWDEAQSDYCRSDRECTPRGVELVDEARGLGNIATVASVAGVAVLGTGIVLVLTSPSRPPAAAESARSPRGLRAQFRGGPGAGLFEVGGVF